MSQFVYSFAFLHPFYFTVLCLMLFVLAVLLLISIEGMVSVIFKLTASIHNDRHARKLFNDGALDADEVKRVFNGQKP